MKLISVHVEGFGKLERYDVDFFEGYNRITERNGWGKSTFAIFLLVMFYGFEDKATADMRHKYAPWSNAVYGGSVVFETCDNTYVLERTFGAENAAGDTFKLYYANNGAPCDELGPDIGEKLFNINAESFMKTAFFGENGCLTESSDDITAKMGNVPFVEADMRSYTRAVERLTAYIDNNSEKNPNSLLYSKREQISVLSESVKEIPDISRRIDECDEGIRELKSKRSELTGSRKAIGDEELKIAQSKEAQPIYEHYIKLKDELEEYEAEGLKNMLMSENQPGTPLISIVSFIAGMAFVLFGMVLFVFGRISLFAVIIAAAVGFAFLLIGLIASVEADRKKETEKEFTDAGYLAKKAEYDSFVENIDIAELEKRALNPLGNESLSLKAKKRDEAYAGEDKVAQEISKLEIQREGLIDRLARCENAKAKLLVLEREVQEGMRKLYVAEQAAYYLQQARYSFSDKYSDPVKNSFSAFYRMLTGKNADNIHIDSSLKVSILERGDYRDEECLSTGTRDVIGLCMRLAMLDVMYKDEKPFLIMDDPFVHMDSYAKENMNGTIKRIPYQTILLEKV